MTPQSGQPYNQNQQNQQFNQQGFNQGYQQNFQPSAPSKGLAIGALICGFLFPIGGIILGIVAFVLASKKPREYGGKSFAVGGIVTGSLITFVSLIALVFVMILAAQESNQTTRTNSSDTTTSRPPTANSLAGTLPGGWVNSKGVKNVFFKDGRFAQMDAQGNTIGGSYKITDSQTVFVQLTVQGKTGNTTFKISVTDDQHIIIDGLNFTRTGYDK